MLTIVGLMGWDARVDWYTEDAPAVLVAAGADATGTSGLEAVALGAHAQ